MDRWQNRLGNSYSAVMMKVTEQPKCSVTIDSVTEEPKCEYGRSERMAVSEATKLILDRVCNLSNRRKQFALARWMILIVSLFIMAVQRELMLLRQDLFCGTHCEPGYELCAYMEPTLVRKCFHPEVDVEDQDVEDFAWLETLKPITNGPDDDDELSILNDRLDEWGRVRSVVPIRRLSVTMSVGDMVLKAMNVTNPFKEPNYSCVRVPFRDTVPLLTDPVWNRKPIWNPWHAVPPVKSAPLPHTVKVDYPVAELPKDTTGTCNARNINYWPEPKHRKPKVKNIIRPHVIRLPPTHYEKKSSTAKVMKPVKAKDLVVSVASRKARKVRRSFSQPPKGSVLIPSFSNEYKEAEMALSELVETIHDQELFQMWPTKCYPHDSQPLITKPVFGPHLPPLLGPPISRRGLTRTRETISIGDIQNPFFGTSFVYNGMRNLTAAKEAYRMLRG